MHEDIYVHLVELPDTINEAITPCNGGYNVAIDPRQSREGMIKSYLHAVKHINDFEKENVQEIERDAHR